MQAATKSHLRRALRRFAEVLIVDLVCFWLGLRTAGLIIAAVLGIAVFGGLVAAFVVGIRQIRSDFRASATRRALQQVLGAVGLRG